MKKEITVNTFLNQIEIKEDGFEKNIHIPDSFNLKEFKLEKEIEQSIKNYLVHGGYILDDINNYKFNYKE